MEVWRWGEDMLHRDNIMNKGSKQQDMLCIVRVK